MYLPTFDAQSKSAEIPNSLYSGGEGPGDKLQFLMLSLNLLKTKFPYVWGGVGWGGVRGGV